MLVRTYKLGPEHPEHELLCSQYRAISKAMTESLKAKGLFPDENEIAKKFWRVLDGCFGAPFTAETIGPCIVGYSTYTPWWSNDRLLVEEFIYRYKPGDINLTLLGLEQIAYRNGCKAVVIGTLAMQREDAYVALLTRKGYRKVAQQLIKEF